MTVQGEASWKTERRSEPVQEIRRSFAEFLTVPTAIVVAFLALAGVAYALDHVDVAWLAPTRAFLRERTFSDAQATSSLLGTVAGGIITVTSITFSLVLLAVQQAAASLTFEVIDQFLRRRLNQVTFGFFVGLALYTLVILSTSTAQFNPVFGATLALLLAAIALYLLLILLYTTINQMRPVQIIETIHDYTLAARERQQVLIRNCRRSPVCEGPARQTVGATRHGFVVQLDVIRAGVRLQRQRDLTVDPAYGIEELLTISWTSVSSSKSNLAPGLLTIRGLRDILARWSAEAEPPADRPPVPVVYTDTVFEELMQAFETLAIVSSESMQHQVFAEIARTFAVMFDRLPAERQARAEDLICRILSGLGDHVLAAELDDALDALACSLAAAGRHETAGAVRTARAELADSIGTLNSRATRVPTRR